MAVYAGPETKSPGISRAAAERCSLKLKSLEDFATDRKGNPNQTTQFSEEEANSYLALNLGRKYHPSLKSLVVAFEKERLQAVAVIDFDQLASKSTKLLPQLIGLLFSGTHTLTVHGQVISGGGKARFQLEQARFDDSTLPKSLVEEIITSVGKKQNPPFDPLQPSKLPYGIEHLELNQGNIMVFQ